MKIFKQIIFLFFLLNHSAYAQEGLTIDTGSLDGVGYKIIFPENWDGKLLMYAHGYEFMGSQPRQSQHPEFVNRMQTFLERGYAVAASDYSMQGFSMPQGVDDTEALRKHFIQKYGAPEMTIMAGTSLGGGVTLATMENFSEHYLGALAMCPFSSRPYTQVRKEFDMYAVFNVLFPDVVPSLSNIMDINVPYKAVNPRDIGPKVAIIKEALSKDSTLAQKFAKQFYLRLEDVPMSLIFNENVLRDIVQKAGGNPFDNTNTLYSGFPDDYELNKKVERLPATVEEDELFGKYDRTGDIGKPVVLMHTTYDQLIPPQYGVVNFDDMVHEKNKEAFLTVKFTNGQGHCRFTPEQIGKAFDELEQWVKTGVKPKPGVIE
jgi:pimeloyl-ACP methyl ester carboxylesterase